MLSYETHCGFCLRLQLLKVFREEMCKFLVVSRIGFLHVSTAAMSSRLGKGWKGSLGISRQDNTACRKVLHLTFLLPEKQNNKK